MRRSSGQRRNRRSSGEEEKEEEKKKQWSANLAIGFSVQSTSSKGGKWLKSILSMIFHKFYAMKRQASVGSQLIIPYLCLLPPHPNSEHLQSHFGTLANLKKWKCACICMHKISKLKKKLKMQNCRVTNELSFWWLPANDWYLSWFSKQQKFRVDNGQGSCSWWEKYQILKTQNFWTVLDGENAKFKKHRIFRVPNRKGSWWRPEPRGRAPVSFQTTTTPPLTQVGKCGITQVYSCVHFKCEYEWKSMLTFVNRFFNPHMLSC